MTYPMSICGGRGLMVVGVATLRAVGRAYSPPVRPVPKARDGALLALRLTPQCENKEGYQRWTYYVRCHNERS